MKALLSRKGIIITVAVMVLVTVLISSVAVFLSSPYCALIGVGMDIRRDGIGGLRPHLVGAALYDFDAIEELAEDEVVSAIIALFGRDDYMRLVKSRLPELSWSLKDAEWEKDKATVTVGFKYDGEFTGVVSVIMNKEGREWMITSFELSEFELKNDR